MRALQLATVSFCDSLASYFWVTVRQYTIAGDDIWQSKDVLSAQELERTTYSFFTEETKG